MNRTRYLTLAAAAPGRDDLLEYARFMRCELIFDFLIAAGAICLFAALTLALFFLFY